MDTNRKDIIIMVAGLVVALVGAGIGLFFYLGGVLPGSQQVSTEDPMDIVHDLYSPWLRASQSTTTNPYQEGLGASPFLSKELRKRLEVRQDGVDPVLCQTVIPNNISMRRVYQADDEMQILVTAKKPATSTEQSVATLRALRDGWYIESIECSPGEFAPVREFSFEKDGKLVKNVPAPYDSQYWHLMFDEEGEPGQYVPLFFTASSSPSNSDAFTEGAAAHVQGQLTERGVIVNSVEVR